jgi:hypothetical protein
MKTSSWVGIFLFLFTIGCGTVPFHETELVPLGPGDPRDIVKRFQAGIPDSFELLNTVVFEYNGRKFTAIGTVQINRAERVFKVAGMNPMGIKLFELSGDQKSVTSHYAIADFSKFGDLASAVGNDIRICLRRDARRPDRETLLRRGRDRLESIILRIPGPGW